MGSAEEILKLIATAYPFAQQLVQTLSDANAVPKKTNEIVKLIGELTPVAAQLVFTLDNIHNQTAEQYAEIWTPIRDDWKATVAKWNGSSF